ncbi:MAG: hypothetical protein WBG38_16755 [Nodosilinea sp.]
MVQRYDRDRAYRVFTKQLSGNYLMSLVSPWALFLAGYWSDSLCLSKYSTLC